MKLPLHLLLVLLGLLFVAPACGVADDANFEDTETYASELRVPGPWAPNANTLAVAATQYVPVVDPPPISPTGSCSSSNAFKCSCRHPSCSPAHAGTVELDAHIRRRFPYLTSGGLYCCRQNSATMNVPKLSVHAIGRAIDLMVPTEGGDANNGLGDPVANWLVENAEFIGIQRVIWDRKYWNGERGFGNLSSNSLSHTNHIHVELTHAGAARLTGFFTSGASTGSCTARCEGTRIINEDCSSGDCAFYGAVCLDGAPPTCAQPPPPEAPEAVPVPDAVTPGMALGGEPGRFNYVTPTRVFDTRTPAASTALTRGNGTTTGPVTESGVNIATISSLPEGANGAWMNFASVLPEENGFLQVYPAGGAAPDTSSLNYAPGTVRANAVPVGLGAGNTIAIETVADVDVVADVSGAFGPTGDGLTSAYPTRVLDTRSVDAQLKAETTVEIDVQAPDGATGVVATIAVISGAEQGFLTAFPCGTPVPISSNINFPAESVVANTVVSKLDANGKLCVQSKVDAHVVVDVGGYFSPDGPLSYQPLVPKRLLDTRDPTSLYENRLAARQVIELPIQSLAAMPEGVWSVVTNLTVVDASGDGFLTAFPCGGSVPTTSSLNFSDEGARAALSVSSVGMNGNLCIFASSRANVIVDVVGVWTHIEALQPPEAPMIADQGDEGDFIDPAEADGTEDPNMDDDGDGPSNEQGGNEGIETSDGCTMTGAPSLPTTPLVFVIWVLGMTYMRRRG